MIIIAHFLKENIHSSKLTVINDHIIFDAVFGASLRSVRVPWFLTLRKSAQLYRTEQTSCNWVTSGMLASLRSCVTENPRLRHFAKTEGRQSVGLAWRRNVISLLLIYYFLKESLEVNQSFLAINKKMTSVRILCVVCWTVALLWKHNFSYTFYVIKYFIRFLVPYIKDSVLLLMKRNRVRVKRITMRGCWKKRWHFMRLNEDWRLWAPSMVHKPIFQDSSKRQ